MQIVYEDRKIQVLVDEQKSTLYFYRKFGRDPGPAIQIESKDLTEIVIEARGCPIVVSMKPK